jgi:hypothetical protein
MVVVPFDGECFFFFFPNFLFGHYNTQCIAFVKTLKSLQNSKSLGLKRPHTLVVLLKENQIFLFICIWGT